MNRFFVIYLSLMFSFFSIGYCTWNDAVNVSNIGVDGSNPQITVDNQNRLIAVWVANSGGNDYIQSSYSTNNGISWSIPIDIPTPIAEAKDPQIIVDPNNNIIIIWVAGPAGTYDILSSVSQDGGISWSLGVKISTFSVTVADNPQLIVNEQNNIIAIWSFDVGPSAISYNISTDGGFSWGIVFTVGGAIYASANNPQIIKSNSGNLFVIWAADDGANKLIEFSSSSDNGTTWTLAKTIFTSAVNTAFNPQILVDSNNNLVAIWSETDGVNYFIQSTYSTDLGVSWSPISQVSQLLTDASNPQIILNFNNDGVAIWAVDDGVNQYIQSSMFSFTSFTWSSPINVSSLLLSAANPEIVSDMANNIYVLWAAGDGANFYIQSSVSSTQGSSWRTSENVSTSLVSASNPQITINNIGITAIWSGNDRIQSSFTAGLGYWSLLQELIIVR